MSLYHAVVLIDHKSAEIIEFGADQVVKRKVRTHLHETRQHGSAVRSEHEFFGEVCDELDGITEVLLAGGHTALADFRHFVEKHRPQVAARIAGHEIVDHPSENELVALARKYFVKHDKMVGEPTSHPIARA